MDALTGVFNRRFMEEALTREVAQAERYHRNLVIMPDSDLVQAGVTVRRLQWCLERWNGSEQREYRLSLSCGVAEYKPGRTIEDVIKAADADLYVEKANRGKVEALP